MKQTLLSLLLLSSSFLANAQRAEVNQFAYLGPTPIQMPYQVDSVDAKAQRFNEESLLKSRINLTDFSKATPFTGEALPTSTGYALHALAFTVTSTQYTKGTLTIDTKAPYELYINGTQGRAGERTYEPGSYTLVVKYLSRPEKNDSIKVALEGEHLAVSPYNATEKRGYKLSDVTDGTRFRSVALSPDGKYMITEYAVTQPGGKSHSYTQLTEVATSKLLQESRESLRWMPRTNRYYLVRQGEQGRELVTFLPNGTDPKVLTTHLPDGSFRFSPTEEYLIYTLYESGTAEPTDVYQTWVPDDRQPGWRNRGRLSLYDLKTEVMQPLTFGYHTTHLSDISADGKQILFQCSNQFLTERPFNRTSLYRMELATMKVDTLLSDEGFMESAQFSPDGTTLLIKASPEAFKGVGLAVNEGQTASMYDGQLFLYHLDTKEFDPITKAFNPSVLHAVWNKHDKQIYLMAENRDCVHLYTYNPVTKSYTALPTPEDMVSQYTLAAEAPAMAFFGQSASNSFRLYSYNLRHKKLECKRDLSAELLRDVELGECRDWNYQSSRGDTIYGRYYLPANFDPTKKYPLIVNYYGGCSPTGRTLEGRYPQHAYAAMGYIVYVVQPSGASGFGQEFAARHVNTYGEFAGDDIVEGTKQFCQAHPFVNEKKIGCIGASYGGFMTQFVCAQSDIFAAAISHAGISNQASYWGEGYWGYSYSAVAAAHSYPWNKAELFTRQSPLFNADKIHTPMLFLHGSTDMNVPVGESIQMYTALKLLGRETAMVTVEGEGHHILDYHKRIKWQNTIFAWFAKHLKDEPTWWEALYPTRNL